MNSPLESWLRRSVWTLAGVALACLLATRELPLPTVILTLTLFPVFLFFETRGRLRRMPWLETTGVLIFFAASAARFFVNREPFVVVVADFLVAFLLVKCAFQKSRGDLAQIVGLSFFVLLSASTLALDFTYLIGFFLYAAAAAWTLCLLTLTRGPVESVAETDRAAVLSRAGRVAWTTVVTVAVLGTGVFVVFPRLSYTVFRGDFLRPARQTGFSETVSLEESGRIFRSPRIAMRVESSLPVGGAWDGKLRGATLNHFDGSNWSARGPDDPPPALRRQRGRTLLESSFQIFHVDRKLLPATDRDAFLFQTIHLEELDTPLLFAAPWVQTVRLAAPAVDIGPDYSVSRPPRFRGRVSYRALSLLAPPNLAVSSRNRGAMKNSAPNPLTAVADPRSLQLPETLTRPDSPLAARIRQLLRRTVSRSDPPDAKIEKLTAFLRADRRYTLNAARRSADPLEDFLFGAKEGHCEHFASALAILLRMEGIPARIVTGFVAREKNETGNYYIVRGRDAHSWVEARVNGAWRTYDPSPAETFAAPERTVFKLLREKVEHLNFLWNAHVLGYDLDAQQKVAGAMTGTTRSLNHKLARLFRPPPERKDSAPAGSVRVWFWIGAAVLLTALGAALRRAPQGGERSRRGDEPEQVRLYRDLLGWLAKHGWTRRAAETPREFAERLAGFQTPEWQRDFRRLTEGYYSARFAGRFASAEELSVLRSTARRLRSRS